MYNTDLINLVTIVSYVNVFIVFAPLTIKWRNFELFMPLMAEQTLFLKGENKMAKLKGKVKAKARKKPNAPKRINLKSLETVEKFKKLLQNSRLVSDSNFGKDSYS